MEHALGEALQESPDKLLELVATRGGRGCKAALLKLLAKCSKCVVRGLSETLFQRVSTLFASFETWVTDLHLRAGHFAVLRACAAVAQAAVTPTSKAFEANELYPIVLLLHDGLVRLDADPDLQEVIVSLCETWWRNDYREKETLVAQSLPFLLAKSFESRKKSDVRRVYAIRDALSLFEFSDDRTADFKHLLIRCILTGTYLRTAEGCRIISLLFSLDEQLGKELFTIIRSEIPSSTKSILTTFGKILYRAWKDSENEIRRQIEGNCVQRLIDGAIHASTKELASSVRTVLGAFFLQKAQDGVEAMLFRLHEPILFRSLQVANADVRRNALLLLIEVFPLQDPGASKEDREAVSEKQFLLLEKILFDSCPDLRCTAVEGVCRILHDFWEALPSQQAVKFLTAVVDDMSKDQTSSVRLSVIAGLTYLLQNRQSHGLLQAFLPRLALMLKDNAISVRIAAADMLLGLKESASLHFSKVAKTDFLLSCLASDNSLIARRLTRLLTPSFLPSELPQVEACIYCISLIRRFPGAGARFCRWALEEGVSRELLLELVKALSRADETGKDTGDGTAGLLACLLEICCSLAVDKSGQKCLRDVLSIDVVTSLMNRVSTPQERSSVLRVASLLPPDDVPRLFAHCRDVLLSCETACSPDSVQEIRAAQLFVLAWGGFSDLIDALMKVLRHVAGRLPLDKKIASQDTLAALKQSGNGEPRGRKRKKSAWSKVMLMSGKNYKDCLSNRLEASAEGSIEVAARAAWQIQNLLAEEATRKPLVSSDAVSHLLALLREVTRGVVSRAQSLQVCGDVEASPVVLAYVRLSLHCDVEEGTGAALQSECKAPMKRRRRGVSSNLPVCPPLKPAAELLKELLGWAGDVQEAPIPDASALPHSSSPPVQPEAKYSRNDNRKQRRERILTNASSPAAEEALVDVLTARASIISVTLQSILEVLSLNLVAEKSLRESCAIFARKAIDWTRDGLVLSLQIPLVGEASTVKRKAFLTYAKVSASYGAKMVYLAFRHGPELWSVISALAHSLLDLLAVSDSYLGGASPIWTGVRPWLPDVLLAVTTLLSPRLNPSQGAEMSRPHNMSANFYCDGELRPWVSHCAKSGWAHSDLEKDVPDAADDALLCTVGGGPLLPDGHRNRSEGRSGDSLEDKSAGGPPVSCVFVDTVVRHLLKGNSLVVSDFVCRLVECTAFLFANQEYSHGVGLLDVICTRILGYRRKETGVGVTLSKDAFEGLQQLEMQVSVVLTSGVGDASQLGQVKMAEKLLKLISTNFSTRSTQDCAQ